MRAPRAIFRLALAAAVLAPAVAPAAAAAPDGAAAAPAQAARPDQLRRLRQLAPDDWRRYLDAEGRLTPEGQALLAAADARAAAGAPPAAGAPVRLKPLSGLPGFRDPAALDLPALGSAFDGSAASGQDAPLAVDARVRNGTLYSATLSRPGSAYSWTAGRLFVDERHPEAAASWYGQLDYHEDGQALGGAVDTRTEASLAWADVRARWLAQPPGPQGGGSDPMTTHGLLAASLLKQAGGAFNLGGPFDAVWSANALVKSMWVVPDASLNETAGLRWRAPGGISAAVLAGKSQELSAVGGDALPQLAAGQGAPKPLSVDHAGSVGLAVWGPVPGVSDLSFLASQLVRRSATTLTREHELVLGSSGEHPVSLDVTRSRETGNGFEYDRTKSRAALTYGLSDRWQAYAAYDRDRLSFGGAQLSSKDVLLGMEGQWGGSSLSVDQLAGGRYAAAPAPVDPKLQAALDRFHKDLDAAAAVMEHAGALGRLLAPGAVSADVQRGADALALALADLDEPAAEALLARLGGKPLTPAQKAFLLKVWGTAAPLSPDPAKLSAALKAALGDPHALAARGQDWLALVAAHGEELQRLDARLCDAQLWTDTLAEAGRAELVTALGGIGRVPLKVGGRTIDLTVDAPALLAAVNVLDGRLSALQPVSEEAAQAAVLKAAGQALGVSGPATPGSVGKALFQDADARILEALSGALSRALAGLPNGRGAPSTVAGQALAALPPDVSSLLVLAYGPDLARLIPPGEDLTPAQLESRVTSAAARALLDEQQARSGVVARGVAQASAWSADVLRRQVNEALAQMMVSSEELDRLVAGRGAKADELGMGLALGELDRLDRRSGR